MKSNLQNRHALNIFSESIESDPMTPTDPHDPGTYQTQKRGRLMRKSWTGWFAEKGSGYITVCYPGAGLSHIQTLCPVSRFVSVMNQSHWKTLRTRQHAPSGAVTLLH